MPKRHQDFAGRERHGRLGARHTRSVKHAGPDPLKISVLSYAVRCSNLISHTLISCETKNAIIENVFTQKMDGRNPGKIAEF